MSFVLERRSHALRTRLLTVTATEWLTPSMRRITLTGQLDGFASDGADDHIKLIFPRPGTDTVELPELGAQGISRDVPRPPMRDYTPRRFDVDAGELVIDFVVHGDGPGATWAAAAERGTTVGQVGPRGSAVMDGVPDWFLLAGDEAAIPSIARRLEELPAGPQVIVRLEVDGPADELPLTWADGARVDLRWIHRAGRAPGEQLEVDVRALALPPGDGFAWVGVEAVAARSLRGHLRDERGLSKAATKVTGYWKTGTSDHHDGPDER